MTVTRPLHDGPLLHGMVLPICFRHAERPVTVCNGVVGRNGSSWRTSPTQKRSSTAYCSGETVRSQRCCAASFASRVWLRASEALHRGGARAGSNSRAVQSAI